MGTTVALNSGESATRYIGKLADGASFPLYYYVVYACQAGSNPPSLSSTFTVSVTDGVAPVTSGSMSVSTRSEVSANAGGNVLSSTIGPGAVIGQIIPMTVKYDFGNPGGAQLAMIQPAGNANFNSACFRLVSTDITAVTGFTAGLTTAADDRLYFTGVNGASSNTATVVYYFKMLCSNVSTIANPFSDLTSGGQLKYTGNFGYCSTSSPPSVCPAYTAPTNPFTISKSVSPAQLPNGGTATYTVVISNPSAYASTIDKITDVLPAGVTFTGIDGTSGVNAANSSSVPSVGAMNSLVFQGIPTTTCVGGTCNGTYAIPAGSSLTLKYTANIPNTPGTYTNNVSAQIGDTTIGSNSTNVTVGNPSISMTKSDGGVTKSPGDTIIYTLNYVNTGNLSLTGITFTETVPANTTFDASQSTAGWSCANGAAAGSTCTLGGLSAAPAATGTAAFAVHVLDTVSTAVTQISNSASVATNQAVSANASDTTPLNHLPVAQNVTESTIGKTATLHLTPLSATDADGTIASYTVSTLPTGAQGTLYLGDPNAGGTQVSANQVLTPAEAANLYFKPNTSFTGTASFTFTATDNLGASDATPATVSIPVASAPPVAQDATETSTKNTVTLALSPLAATDSDGTISSYTLTALPNAAQGDLYLGNPATVGIPVSANQVLTPAEAANLYFVPNTSFIGTASFTFTATDDDNLSDATPATISIPVTNSPPTAQNATETQINGTTTLHLTSLAATDNDGTIDSYTVTTLPTTAQGTLYLGDPTSGGTQVTVNQVLTPAEAANLYFKPDSGFVGNASFTFTATDNNSASDVTPATVSIPVVNTPPVAQDATEAAVMNNQVATLSPLAATDVNDTVASYTITSLPSVAQGTLYLGDPNAGGTLVSVDQVLTPAEAANLYFRPKTSFVGTASFAFTATDTYGTPDGTPATVSIPVTNDPPIAQGATATATDPITTVHLGALAATDSNGTIVNYIVSTLPTVAQGTLYLGNPTAGGTLVSANQVLTPAQASNLYFVPNTSFIGTASFTFTATDNNGATDTTPATISIPVSGIPPVAQDKTETGTNNATPLHLSALVATDADGTIASYTIGTLPTAAQGTLYLGDPNAGGTLVTANQVLTPAEAANLYFKPNASFVGTASFTFTATDNHNQPDATPATVSIPVSSVPPVAQDKTETGTNNATPLHLSALVATDADGTIASYTIGTLPTAAQGALYLGDPNAGGTLVTANQVLTPAEAANLYFKPNASFVGTASFTFTATDNNGETDATPATISIPVSSVPPVAQDKTETGTNNATPLHLSALVATDADGTIASYTISTLPTAAQGSLYLGDPNAGGTLVSANQVLTPAEAANLYFKPNANFVGTASFTFTATDNNGATDATPATISIPVSSVPPVAQDKTETGTNNATPLHLSALAATDADGTIASYTVSTLPTAAQGSLYLGDPNAGGTLVTANQVLTPAEAANLYFKPNASFVGTASFTFTATDNNSETDATPATISIPVSVVPPVAQNATETGTNNTTPLHLSTLAATDADGTIASYTVSTLPTAAQGTLYLGDPNAGGTLVTANQVLTPAEAANLYFKPNASFIGTASFTFTATDNNGETDATPATISIPVSNTAPVATNDTATTNMGTAVVVSVTQNDNDPNNDAITVTAVTQPAHGNVTLIAGVVTYIPAPGYSGTDTFTYTIIDAHGGTATATVTITINLPPDPQDITVPPITPDAPAHLPSLNATDDGTVVSYTIVSLPPSSAGVLYLGDPANGGTPVVPGQVLTLAQAANLYFVAAPGFSGDTQFTYTATDNQGVTATTPAVMSLRVGAPTAIQLTSLGAVRTQGRVVVSWTTASEQGSLGFAVYRSSDSTFAHAERVSGSLIVARGSSTGGSTYRWEDTSLLAGQSATYWLVEIELSGASHTYGPVQVVTQTSGVSHQLYVPMVTR